MTRPSHDSSFSWPAAGVLALGVFLSVTVPVAGNDRSTAKSAVLCKQLVTAMTDRQLTAIAAPHPDESGRYVAAMLFPGVQLLLISARSSEPAYIESQLTPEGFANVYAALQQGVPESKLFIQDMGSDGLLGPEGGMADIVYRRGKDERVFNGDHKLAGMSRSAYADLVRETDEQYSALLTLLFEAVKKLPQAPPIR